MHCGPIAACADLNFRSQDEHATLQELPTSILEKKHTNQKPIKSHTELLGLVHTGPGQENGHQASKPKVTMWP